jgi:hypothetical protein
MRTDILKPGFLVALGTTLEGGVSYERSEQARETEGNGALSYREVVDWRTKRTTEDAVEHEKAVKARSLATNAVKRICARVGSQGTLLCPLEKEEELDAAIAEAHSIADSFNADARHTRVSVSIYKARMSESDEVNTRAIANEIKSLLAAMESGVVKLDAEGIRNAANRARQVGAMLESADAERVDSAISAARKAARAIVKRVEKGGEQAADVLRDLQTRPIETARFAFLDSEEQARFAGLDSEGGAQERLPSLDRQRFADIETETSERVDAPRASTRRELDSDAV